MSENTQKLGQEPAFPMEQHNERGELYNIHFGMSKRFYAACAAMQGILSSNEIGIAHHPETVIKWAYSLADELLKQENI